MINKKIGDKQKTIKNLYHSYIRKKWLVLLILFIIIIFTALISINSGSASINMWDTLKTLAGKGSKKANLVIWSIRMPRIVTAIVAGAGLSVAGCIMQNNLKNPLASPFTLGISSAAAFGANLAIITLGAGTILYTAGDTITVSNPYLVSICSFISSMGATIVILSLGKIKRYSPEAIILAGVAIGSLFSAATTLIQYFASDIKIAAAIFWTFGDLGRVNWHESYIITIVITLSAIYFFLKRWDYNAMNTGTDTAKSLGVHTEKIRFWGLLLSSLVTSITVAFLGMIGFVGLIGPHIIKRLIGSDHRFLIPASMLTGSILLLVSDTLARTIINPVVLPVGALTSLFGAPLFIYTLLRETPRRKKS